MSYDLGLRDRHEKWYPLTVPHQMRGGTFCLGGTHEATINITYNYARHFERVLKPRESSHHYAREDGKLYGIRSLYGLTGAESIPLLIEAIDELKDDVDNDYWKSTEGNARAALKQCLALARMCPDGIWDGD